MLNRGPLSWIFGNFRTSGLYTFYSGHPFTVNAGSTLAIALYPYGFSTATPFFIGTPHAVAIKPAGSMLRKDCLHRIGAESLKCLCDSAFGTIWQCRPEYSRGPRTDVLDAALMRDFPIDRGNAEARWEVFNVTNTPDFGQPGNNITSGSAGSITSLAGDPRVMQFALRISF